MEETKNCPFCDKDVLSIAKKCKHCGQWLEKKCQQCGEWIKADAKKCRFCGSWLNKFAKEKYERENTTATVTASSYSKRDIEDAIEDNKGKKDAGCLITIECALIVGVIGFVYDWLFWQFIIAWVVGYTLLMIQILRIFYSIGISIVWAFVGFSFAPTLFEDTDLEMASRVINDTYSDYWWMAALFGIVSLLFHWPFMKSQFNF